ncbi:MAG: TfoX/Sxy family protein [Pirellulales bacterium]
MDLNETLAENVRRLLNRKQQVGRKDVAQKELVEKKLFGGIAFLLRGNICCGVWKEHLILRLGDDIARHVLGEEHTRPFDPTGKPMRGWVMVEPTGWQDAAGLPDTARLRRWIAWAVEFTNDLPPK